MLVDRGPPRPRERIVDGGPHPPDSGADSPVTVRFASAGQSRGISSSAGGSTGVRAHGSSAVTTAAGSWYRWTGFLAIILLMTASRSFGTSGRRSRTGLGVRV